jgi:hypothetical protein
MRRLLAAVAVALLGAACSDSPCQKLGERLCSCTGLSSDSCRSKVEGELEAVNMSESTCEAFLATCQAPDDAELCEWLLTSDGKRACGLAVPQADPEP